MTVVQETHGFRANLDELRAESLTLMALFAGAIGFVWLCWVIWPLTGRSAPGNAWIGACLLTLSVIISYTLKDRHLGIATHVLVWGVCGAIASAVLAFESLEIAYLFILPIILASALLGQSGVFLVAFVASLSIFTIHFVHTSQLSSLTDVALPIAAIVLGTVASWFSACNLYMALAWVWSGYERARRNEQIAREQQAELKRVLKSLDETNHRLERTSYMLTLARDQAEEARRLKQQFAQTISHELRTPLNLIVGFTEMMAQSPEHYDAQLPRAYLRDLSIVHRNACHLQNLVNDVLDLTCIEAAQMSLLPEETDPATLAQDAVNTARSLIETRGLALWTEIEPDLPCLWVDPIRIRQVLFNLLNNAARFTERGSVTVSVCRQGDEVVFAVSDTGVGIAPENIPHIFEEFYQLDGSTRRRHGGSGLGLAISRRFVEMHGGRIWVESQPDEGSNFYFSLPANRADPVSVVGGYSVEAVTRPMPAPWGEEPVLLVVTRSPSAAALITRYVSGYRAVVYHDLKQARDAAKRLIPQAVIIDRACEALSAVKLEELALAWELPNIPFIACPLPGGEPLRQELMVDGYLVKPVSRRNLWDVLRQFGEDVDRILVIDDDRDFVRLMSRMLNSRVRRHQVISAYSGQEGLAMLYHRQPDLILLDLVLPDMDGFQVLEHIRSSSAWRHTPIVVVSAQDELGSKAALTGAISITRADGLVPGEVVQWVQAVLDTATRTQTSQEVKADRQVTSSLGRVDI